MAVFSGSMKLRFISGTWTTAMVILEAKTLSYLLSDFRSSEKKAGLVPKNGRKLETLVQRVIARYSVKPGSSTVL